MRTRKPTNGPEYHLVKQFIDYKVSRFQNQKNRKTKLAIFVEPFLETGFPDMVFSEYDPGRFDQWSDNRFKLSVIDLKVFYHILRSYGIEGSKIQKQLGMDGKILLQTIEKLLDAGLIMRRSKQWRAKRLSEFFGVKKLIAVEAKMNNWAEVFNQAWLNQWFASESYVLSPVIRPEEKHLIRSEMLGVGIYVSGHQGIKKVRPSSISPMPSCYASLLFNEWIGRRLSLGH
ncbi:MAG: MarR family winged helix-turn-helix transcriptional regulator [Firmicutes bacterium]|nr:MarR family winged helix-turn-helix transcriptional regulator [Bacillota bacterium]